MIQCEYAASRGTLEVETIRTYQIFGIGLASDYHFSRQLRRSAVSPDLSFMIVDSPPFRWQPAESKAAYISPYQYDGKSIFQVYSGQNCDIFHYVGVADFFCFSDRILCHVVDERYRYLVEVHFLGRVLALWLERRGIVALHASSIVLNESAVAFVAANQGGKSTLAASFAQNGLALISDDLLALENDEPEFLAHPGYAEMRMWPDSISYFSDDAQNLPRVVPQLSKRVLPVGEGGLGWLADRPYPLRKLYFIARRNEEMGPKIIIEPASKVWAVAELGRSSFLVDMLNRLDMQRSRLEMLARLAGSVEICVVNYPSGLDNLRRTRAAILADLT